MMQINSELSADEAILQLNNAREEIIQLQELIQKIYNEFRSYKKQEQKVSANVEFLYHQLAFLKHAHEQFIDIVIKNGKIMRIEATNPG